MFANERTEYHWIEGRVVPRIVIRPPWIQKWRFDLWESSLIATIEDRDRSFELREGPAYSPELEVDAIRMHRGVHVGHTTQDFSNLMPADTREELQRRLEQAVVPIIEQWASFAEETDITGLLKGELTKIRIDRAGWRIHVNGWTYKRYPKENEIGADLGVIFDVIHEGRRLIKAVWYQAKIDKGVPMDKIPDLTRQIEDMNVYTKEAYSLLYGKDRVVAMRGLDISDMKPLSENLTEGAICIRGDRNPLVVANTVDCKHVVTFFISD